MIPLYTIEQFEHSKYREKLPCKCYECNNTFYLSKTHIQDSLNPNCKRTGKYCSQKCSSKARNKKETYKCHNCEKECIKKISQIKLSKSGFNFCSRHCTSSYHIKHKTYGTNRSKLEKWIEQQLISLYPNLNIIYNDTKTVGLGLELDIFIPTLNLAFELNGVFHYEPIFGVDKLQKTQNKDKSKSKFCFDNKIDFCIIDTTSQKYFKEHTSKIYLDIITKIIDERLI